MITKAIVEEIVDTYRLRIRIPVIDRMSDLSAVSNSESDLNVAAVCSLPNCHMNLQPGDIVFVSIDDLVPDDIVVLGSLYCSKETKSLCDMLIQRLNVTTEVVLPDNTTVGNVLPEELSQLSGVRDNIQKQIDALRDMILTLSS